MLTTHILRNIPRSKGNQTMNFGQFMEYNRNVFLKRWYRKCGGETSLKPFCKISKWGISLDQHSARLHSLFLLYVQVEGYQSILKLRCWPLTFTSSKAFRNKKSPGTSVAASFSPPFALPAMIFDEKYFSCYVLLTDQFHCLIVFLRYCAICIL